jgi:hypothetical protein
VSGFVLRTPEAAVVAFHMEAIDQLPPDHGRTALVPET